ncbi:MAG: T9SS type A sorting domain-containing protein [Flavobacterium sp.]|nr:T9SS type A sorting domain-containing protein [Flavobacterium sp.]
MKKITTFFLLLLFSFLNAQVINFIDPNFKAKLLLSSTSSNIAISLNNTFLKIDANNNGEIEESEALAVKKLDVSSSNLVNMTEITFFTNLTELNCSYNAQLSSSIDLHNANGLKKLQCEGTQVSSLNVANLSQLQTIAMMSNELTTLDLTGLTSLTAADFRVGKFESVTISDLPNLRTLNLTNCNLLSTITLDNLPQLWFFNCNDSNLSQLNLSNLPSLQTLDCFRNHLTVLDINSLTSLTDFNCSDNQIANLDISALSNLTKLTVQSNSLTSLNLSAAPNLIEFSCGRNFLTSLAVENKPNLRWLTCLDNNLNSLVLSNLPGLYYLECSNNEINEIANLNEFHNLGVLNCSGNNISTLDVSNIPNLVSLKANSNQLVSLFMKNGSTASTLDIGSNSDLQYICADEVDMSGLQPFLGGMPNCVVNSYCSFVPGGAFYTINGNQRFDSDENGCDETDFGLGNLKFRLSSGANSETFIGNPNGSFTMPVQAGTYVLSPVIERPEFYLVSPETLLVTFPNDISPSSADFCISRNGLHNDLEVSIFPLSTARPGFDATYKIKYKNIGNTIQSGNVALDFPNNLADLVSSVPPISTENGNLLTWNYSNLNPFEEKEILLTFNLNSPLEIPAVNGGDWLGYLATIDSQEIDEYSQNNRSELKQLVVNSFDPNDKICIEGNIVGPQMIGKDVHYIIHFENTGTAAAENIVVKDIIDVTKFDINSLIPLDGSHQFVTKISNTNKVEFIFENINLPFDNDNNDGYVAFKIKTKPTLILGDSFSNKASIYFDYNAPIVTNNATTIIQVLAVKDFEFTDYFNMYPNPANSLLNIVSKNEIDITSIEVYNILGQLVLAIPNENNISSIDVSSLKPGNYFIKINSDKGTTNAKFAKN